ncbi:amidase family protein [Streptomyces odontomachi]|uniref:amidase family protein n=1 Tax=Streptomyces odontomachi TaxID=2944940 RepID=UPI00210A3B9F|nr:amidase family protein [Streptomyces sp. ODS25]
MTRGPAFPGSAGNDHHGVLTRTVRGTARFLDVVRGTDETDPASLPAPARPFEEQLATVDPGGLRIAPSTGLGFVPCEPRVAAVVRGAAEALTGAIGGREVPAEVTVDGRCGAAFRTLSAPRYAGWSGTPRPRNWRGRT